MSKMNDIALQLDERAVELGFADHLEALGNGYEWGVKGNGEAFLFNPKKLTEQEKAHEAWLKEKHEILHRLESIKEDIIDLTDNPDYVTIDELDEVIDFIEKGEM